MIDEADLDGDGKIDYGEFLVLLRERTRTFFKVTWQWSFHLQSPPIIYPCYMKLFIIDSIIIILNKMDR